MAANVLLISSEVEDKVSHLLNATLGELFAEAYKSDLPRENGQIPEVYHNDLDLTFLINRCLFEPWFISIM